MKRLFYFLVFAVLGITSCGVKVPTVEPFVSTRIESGEVQKQLFSLSASDSLTSTVQYSYYPTTDSLYKDSVNRKIQRFIASNTSFSTGTPSATMSRKFVEHQLDSFELLYQYEVKEYGGDYDPPIWNLEVSVSIDESANEYVRIDLGTWSYTGGAHGNGFSQVLHIERKSGADLQLVDFFSNVAALTEIGEGFFRQSQDLGAEDDLTEAGFWFEDGVFQLNENFSFSGDAILFFYNQYEIAPYSAGTIEFEIPLEKVKHLLQRKIG